MRLRRTMGARGQNELAQTFRRPDGAAIRALDPCGGDKTSMRRAGARSAPHESMVLAESRRNSGCKA
jgi:hypothetical protein